MANKDNSGSTQTKSPKGSTKLVTAVEHDERRRAQKRKQKANARKAAAHKKETGGTFIEGLRQDQIEERQAAKRRRQELQELWLSEQRACRMQEAFIAADAEVLTRLERGTTADKMARAIIGQYPVAEPICDDYGNVIVSSFREAIRLARIELNQQDLARKRAVNYGISVANEVLKKAGLELKRQSK